MAASFGEQLRLAREARGISLREISEQTRISLRYLEAIEANDFKRLPGGIFNRSFIKAYAKQIGFDEHEALDAYAREFSAQGAGPEDTTPQTYKPHVYTDGDQARSPLVTFLLTVLILAVLSLGVYAALHFYQQRRAPNVEQSAQASRQTNAPPVNAASSQTPAQPGATQPAPVTGALNIQIKALNDKVWFRARSDEADATEAILEPNETREFQPAQSLKLQYARIKAKSLEVTINGRTAQVPSDAKGNLAEMLITKDDYEKFLQ